MGAKGAMAQRVLCVPSRRDVSPRGGDRTRLHRAQLGWGPETLPGKGQSPIAAPGGLMLLPAVPHRHFFQVGHSADQGTENFTAAAAPNVQKERDSGVGA